MYAAAAILLSILLISYSARPVLRPRQVWGALGTGLKRQLTQPARPYAVIAGAAVCIVMLITEIIHPQWAVAKKNMLNIFATMFLAETIFKFGWFRWKLRRLRADYESRKAGI